MFRDALVAAATLVLSVSATAQPPWQPPRTPDGQPDMQGLWQNDAAGAVRSLEGDHSRWKGEYGIITNADPTAARPSYIIDTPDRKIPYQPWAAARLAEFRANMEVPTKLEHVDPHARAWPDGVPRTNHVPGEIQILQTPGYVVMTYSSNHQYRIIPLDGRPHVGKTITLFNGDSRGRWEGNTLVVDVTNQNDRTWLDFLSFHGEGLHVVERWTLTGPDRIDYQATVEDSTMFTRPWTIAFHFNRHREEGYEIWEDARHEGERDAERMLRGGSVKGRDR